MEFVDRFLQSGLVKGTLKRTLKHANLVTREEFDAQQRVLENAHRTLMELESRLEILQKQSDSKTT